MLTIWVLQTGEPLHTDKGNPRPMRAMNLANALTEAGHNVILWSSAFYHQEKRHRSHHADRVEVSPRLEIRLIPSPGYKRNIGPGRIWDHLVLARNLKQLLKQETVPPDVAFIGYPPIETAAVMTRWLAARGVPCMLDVKDQWPTLFVKAFPAALQWLGRVALSPYFFFARRAMCDAKGLTAMADDFLRWAIQFAGRQRNEWDLTIPLTSPTGQVTTEELVAAQRWWDDKGMIADGRARVCFVGSHASVFDFFPVCEAAKFFVAQGRQVEFVICGDGGSSVALRNMMLNLPNVCFPGWVDRAQIEALALRSLAALAPYKNTEDFVMSVPNKVVDSLSLGLPILSPLPGEVANLISIHGVGLRYGTDSGKSLVQCIETLMDNPALRQQISINALNLYQEKFSFERVYGGLVKHLEALSLKKRPGA